ncbi:MAG TPA: hypothetical protein VFW75_12255 [Acetobacteraceae bacterium]|nr:hypothetical protein [Acetobacteraceae bacterium]
MRWFGAAILGAALTVPLAVASVPAQADNDVLGQMQRLFNGNQSDRNAYERGRADQARQQHERWRERHDRAYNRDQNWHDHDWDHRDWRGHGYDNHYSGNYGHGPYEGLTR